MDERKLKGLALRSLISDCQESVKLRGEGKEERGGRREGGREGGRERQAGREAKREGGREGGRLAGRTKETT